MGMNCRSCLQGERADTSFPSRCLAKNSTSGALIKKRRLSKCIEKDLVLTSAERKIWLATKEKGLNLFDPKRGGSYELLNTRRLSEDLCLYCAQDVQYLPLLWSGYFSKLNPNMLGRVKTVAADRVKSSQSETHNGHGQHKAIGPW
jgi:exonuclease 3'-5' domain-containing protein 1